MKRFFGFLKKHILECITVILLAITGIVMAVVKNNPFVAEYIFARGIFKILSVPLAFVMGFLPFSLAEYILYGFIIGAIVCIIVFVIKLVKCFFIKEKPVRTALIYILKGVRNVAFTGAILLFVFTMMCGTNYYRYDFEKFCDFEVREYTVDELYELCVFLANKTNESRENVTSIGKDGTVTLNGSFYHVSGDAADAMRKISKKYESIGYIAGRAKPILMSRYMSYTEIVGIYSPFTIEANVNNDVPEYGIPFTMCHELSHLCGYMKEEEANYIAYLACVNSDSPEFNYSGYATAYIYASNKLYREDYELFCKVDETISDDVWKDFYAEIEYWEKFEETELGETIGDVSDSINDSYLEFNGQEEGTKSYGMIVDLLLADFLSKK
ncbi:MAG: DUF3810 domain-containing protein [Lachnospiraceae bacterium]|nr:DUF3810 domain-containing protein [Lachnospiraceae bacterium]